MTSKLHIPAFPLNLFIESFYYYRDFNPDNEIDRFVPDGNVHLIFELTGVPQYTYDNESLEKIRAYRKAWFSGIRKLPITIPAGKGCEMLIVNFRKGKAHSFLCEPMHSLTNLVVDAEQAFGRSILEIWERILEAPDIDGKFCVLEKALLRHYGNYLEDDPFVDHAVSRILAFPDRIRLDEISRSTGYSQKHIIQLFKRQVGVTPKEFMRIIRFQKAVESIERQEFIDWPGISYDCGYYDQSHFIADFKNFSGFTPRQYMDHKGIFLNYIPVR